MKIRINNNALKKIENSQVAPIVHAEARKKIPVKKQKKPNLSILRSLRSLNNLFL